MKKDFNVILNNRFTILEDDTELTIESFNKAMEEGGGGEKCLVTRNPEQRNGYPNPPGEKWKIGNTYENVCLMPYLLY